MTNMIRNDQRYDIYVILQMAMYHQVHNIYPNTKVLELMSVILLIQ